MKINVKIKIKIIFKKLEEFKGSGALKIKVLNILNFYIFSILLIF